MGLDDLASFENGERLFLRDLLPTPVEPASFVGLSNLGLLTLLFDLFFGEASLALAFLGLGVRKEAGLLRFDDLRRVPTDALFAP